MNSTDSYSPNYNRDIVHDDEPNRQPADQAGTAVAAVFADREAAHDAVHRLHDEGFRQTWIGIARTDEGVDYSTSAPAADDTRIESDNWFMRFFGEGDESLHDALLRRGVSESDARAAGTLPARSALLTVDGSNHPELAAQIITQSGGQLITRGFGATGYGTAGVYGSSNDRDLPAGTTEANAINSQAPDARTTSLYDEGVATAATVAGQRDLAGGSAELRGEKFAAGDVTDPELATDRAIVGSVADRGSMTAGNDRTDGRYAAMTPPDMTIDNPDGASYDDYGRYRAGTPVDESTRLQLREERLRVDKSRVSRGEATVGTDVVTETQNLDVPLVREELFVSRRPVSGTSTDDRTPIGGGEVIRVPLSEEKLTVTKVPVITEEVVVGKREVENVQHISETTRKETLNVNDAAGSRTDVQRS